MSTNQKNIRNFSIVAHIDHGKSTLADRLIHFTGGLSDREMSEQVLDNMDIEKERGITIKAQTVRLEYTADDGEDYILNLMDTPGHVDFAYEVSRSLSACEGSLLVVDASQGVEAQTLANVYQAIDHDHEIVPVLNKIDLPAAEPEQVRAQIEDVIGIDASDAILASAKSGIGIKETLEAIVTRLPAPTVEDPDKPLKAMLVDAWYDTYMGVIVLFRVIEGTLKKGMRIRTMSTGASYVVDKVGVFMPKPTDLNQIGPGEVGFFTGSIKEVADAAVGDTITEDKRPTDTPLEGFKPAQPVVFCGIFPVDAADLVYTLSMTDGTEMQLHNPADMPDIMKIDHIAEPWIKCQIMTPDEYLGGILKLCQDRRGIQTGLSYVAGRAMVEYELPLNEVVFDFYDRLKSVSKGYASFDYQAIGTREGNLVKMSILVNGDPVDALSMLVHRDRAESRGRMMCERLKDLIPRHLFKIPVQAAIGGRIIARETIAAMRKDVTAKCYGGDASRKRKLLDKQKKGKKRMRQFGSVEIPQEAFIAALKMDD